MKKCLILIPILMFFLATNLWATTWSGILDVGAGLYATTEWSDATLNWSVMDPNDLNNTTGHWVYTYEFNTGIMTDASQISHLIIQVSDDFTRADMLPGTTQLTSTYPYLQTFDPGNDNPGVPADWNITGIKWEDPTTPNSNIWTVTIVTDRAYEENPTAGNFYAVDGKGGTGVYALTDGTGAGLPLTPDTKMAKVPEPTTLVLYGLGFVAAGIYRRLRRTK